MGHPFLEQVSIGVVAATTTAGISFVRQASTVVAFEVAIVITAEQEKIRNQAAKGHRLIVEVQMAAF